jgi:hypothetical protein
MENSDIVSGMVFKCINQIGDYYTEGKVYESLSDCTIRDNFGYDYDVLFVDENFELIDKKFLEV